MSLADDLAKATTKVSKDWKKAKQNADKEDRVSNRSIERMRYTPPARTTVREVAFAVMEAAYNKASSNGKLPANARQIMYAARPTILARADTEELNDVYFTQTLLKDYIEINQPSWQYNVMWDARGNLIEPHTRNSVALGGVGVRKYTASWLENPGFLMPGVTNTFETKGPAHRYSNALFIEKEGFTEILSAAQIPELYDIALMSTKGIPTDASCDLIQELDSEGVRVFVLHDFDLAGFKIVKTLREGTRLSCGTDVIDLGLRYADIGDLGSEPVTYKQRKDPRHYLRECGATSEEINFLVNSRRGYSQWDGQRVEINEMTSEQLVDWLKTKFDEHGVEKMVPDNQALEGAYQKARGLLSIKKRIEELVRSIEKEDSELVPADLTEAVFDQMKNGSQAKSWDAIIWELARKDRAKSEEDT